MEVWRKFVKGIFAGRYEVSDKGNVWSTRGKGRMLRPCKKENGYLEVKLQAEGKIVSMLVHRLVALAFIPNPDNKPHVNHKNGNKEDNSVPNLEWSTSQENIEHAFANGLSSVGEGHGKSNYTNAQIVEVKKLLSQGYSCTKVAKMTGVSRKVVYDVSYGRTWSHLDIT